MCLNNLAVHSVFTYVYYAAFTESLPPITYKKGSKHFDKHNYMFL